MGWKRLGRWLWSAEHVWKGLRQVKGKGRRRGNNPQKTVWVGNLPEGTTYEELKAHADMAGVGATWAEAYKNKGKGTGAIGFKTPEEAQNAALALNGSVFKGVQIQVDAWEKQKK